MRAISVFILFLGISMLTAAVPVKMVAPFQQEIKDGDSIFLGTIGPGQTLEVQINPIVTSGGIYGSGGAYDFANITSRPAGWSNVNSKLYGGDLAPLQVKLTADKDAPAGEYRANITVFDENNGEKLGNVTFTVRINVTWDVMDFNVTPSYVLSGPDQPAQFRITVRNKGSASDTYMVSASGPKRWEFEKQIYVPANSSRTIVYEISAQEEESYNPLISVESSSSANIRAQKNVTLVVQSDLLGDYKSTNNGVLLFPVFEAPIYSLAGLIGAVLTSLGF